MHVTTGTQAIGAERFDAKAARHVTIHNDNSPVPPVVELLTAGEPHTPGRRVTRFDVFVRGD